MNIVRRGLVLVGLSGPGYAFNLALLAALVYAVHFHGLPLLSPVVLCDAAGILLNVALFPWYWKMCARHGLVARDPDDLRFPSGLKDYLYRAFVLTVNMLPGYLANICAVGVVLSLTNLGGELALLPVVFGDVSGAGVNVLLFPYFRRLCVAFGIIVPAQ